MEITISAEEVLTTVRRDFPLEYELSVQRVINARQARRIAELEQARAAEQPAAAAAAE